VFCTSLVACVSIRLVCERLRASAHVVRLAERGMR